jgi:hypothetical protein
MDSVWLACDCEGHLATFVTAGLGPIPIEALKFESILIEDIEQLLLDLPTVSDARLLVSIERSDSFVALANRGLFVYDWTDIHKSDRKSTGSYELVAVPMKPISVDRLPGDLAILAMAIRFGKLKFSDERLIDVRAHILYAQCA